MPTDKKNLIFCVHAHQPVGNFGNVFEEAYQKSYRPFFEAAASHPNLKLSAHFSGSLLDWLDANHPEFLGALKGLHDKGQLEFLGGGYYEPIYGMIPQADLLGQIALMRKKLRQFFGAEFEGVWLTERVWDPELVGPLKKAGVQFTVLDDLHFEKSGITHPVTGYYQTGSRSQKINLFASMKDLRYLMPFQKAELTIDFIHKTAASERDVFVFADDCEKFGMWPGTYDWVYNQKWLDQFFRLAAADAGIRLCHFSDVLNEHKPKSSVEIGHSSYAEMMEWSGGRFYNFFEKYSESAYMRDRMEAVSRRSQKNKKALAHVYKAQCNCSYWHGVFGGLYLHHLRSSVFENLIEADRLVRKKSGIRIDMIGKHAYARVDTKHLTAYFNPAYGASLEELDFLPKSANLTCCLSRRKEPYHDVATAKRGKTAADRPLSIHEMLGAKEANLKDHLFYDLFRRVSFLDHFFDEPIGRDAYLKCAYVERGDFAGRIFDAKLSRRGSRLTATFKRQGAVKANGFSASLSVQKTVSAPGSGSVQVEYGWTNEGSKPVQAAWGVEFNFSIGDAYANQGVEAKQIKKWVLNDAWRGLSIETAVDHEMDFLAAPIETVSESESGLERTFQQLGVLWQRPLFIQPGECFKQRFVVTVS